MVTSAHQFIGDKGVPAIRLATGRSEGAVRVWKHRNRFPREVWPELAAAFPDELSLDVLRLIEFAPKPRGERKARAQSQDVAA